MFNSMKTARATLAVLAGLALVLSACAGQPGTGSLPNTGSQATEPQVTETQATEQPTSEPLASTPVSHGNEIGSHVELVDALREAGAMVEPAGEIEEPIFDVQAQRITVNGADVQVFEFSDVAAREAAASTISANGYTIGTAAVDWISQPYFWAKGRLIVLYVGADPGTIALLSDVLGEPLTAPQSTPQSSQIEDFSGLVEALKTAGAAVEPAGEVEQEFFGPTGQVIEVNGAEVQVFEYPDETAREAESSLIAPDGSSIGTTMVTWVDEPHFWANGRLIVLYVGSNPAIVSLLTQALGTPLTQ